MRKAAKRKAAKRKTAKRKTAKRKTAKRKTAKLKTAKRKTAELWRRHWACVGGLVFRVLCWASVRRVRVGRGRRGRRVALWSWLRFLVRRCRCDHRGLRRALLFVLLQVLSLL
jgi:hypothetical protein